MFLQYYQSRLLTQNDKVRWYTHIMCQLNYKIAVLGCTLFEVVNEKYGKTN